MGSHPSKIINDNIVILPKEIKELAIVILILLTKIKNYIKLCLKCKAMSEIT